MEQPKNHEEPQEYPGYYGTGRRRETDKSRLPLIVSLLAVILAANLLTLAVHIAQKDREGEAPTQSTADVSAAETYPARKPLTASAENESSSFGMELSALDDAERRYWDLPEGVIVRSVASGSIAAKSGILPGDILLTVDETAVKDASDYFAVIEAAAPGEKLCITVYRCGTHYILELTIPVKEQALHREA